MSVPHTGRLTARIDGQEYQFNGDRWTGPAGQLLEDLQWARNRTPVHHLDIREVATAVARTLELGDRFQIVTAAGDSHPEDLPPGDLD